MSAKLFLSSFTIFVRSFACLFKQVQHDVTGHLSYKLFSRRIFEGSRGGGPTASTPLATGRQCEPSFEFDPVCQRLELDSPPRRRQPVRRVPQVNIQETVLVKGVSYSMAFKPPGTSNTTRQKTSEEGWVWRAAAQEHANFQQSDCNYRRHNLTPFTVLDKASVSLQGQSVMKLAVTSLVNDYYTDLLDCSCNGMIALALGSSVCFWNSETGVLAGHLDLSKQPGRPSDCEAISCLCWSKDGKALCVGTRRGETQLWDVEHQQRMSHLPSHLSVVRGLSWKQQLLSNGSLLGQIHHLDPRASTPLIGAAVLEDKICSLQWSPGGDQLAIGSEGGLLCIWNSDVAGLTRSHQPVTTMKQLSAVKAMGWCPWQGKMIATGGGWTDGELRIWDTNSGTCVSSVKTYSQICCLRWAEKKRYLATGHGVPQHHVSCWTWDSPSLTPTHQLTGHSQRVLHLALNPDNTQTFSAGADQRFHVWAMQPSASLDMDGE
ncbi:cell division cycle protein 20 homolog B-like [Antennarius striatus]|uniref:cell division cycle protein 20 homolog B-like n=1 Tax=Antennarius striatus TaxID=241820 RepID=UPI0035B42E47